MGIIRKILGIIFSVAGLLCLAAFTLTWYGPWVREVSSLMSNEYFYWTVAVLAGITAIGLLVTLIRSLAGRRVDNILVKSADGGLVTITRDAVASLATKIIEADGTCIAEEIDVAAKPKGDIRVKARVRPISTVPVLQKGEQLTAELRSGLASLCGNELRAVELTFTEPQTEHYEPAPAAPAPAPVSYPERPPASAQVADQGMDADQVRNFPVPQQATVAQPAAAAPADPTAGFTPEQLAELEALQQADTAGEGV